MIAPTSPKRVLVGYDFRSSADRAVDWAIRVGDAVGAELILCYVIEPRAGSPNGSAPDRDEPSPGGSDPLTVAAAFDAGDVLRRLRARALRLGAPDAQLDVQEGLAAVCLLRRAVELGADLVVVGAGERGDSLGGVAQEVVRAVAVVAVVVRGS